MSGDQHEAAAGGVAMKGKQIDWPRADYSRIPNVLYHDPALYEVEQERIFQGKTWLFMGYEAEVPKSGDFRRSYLGDIPVVFNRLNDGSVHAFVNRCAHKGAIVRREECGNARTHVCIYHQWAYDQKGNLVGVPFQRGIGGEGGASPEFRREDHPLRKLRVESLKGLLFATFSNEVEPLRDYLGEKIVSHIESRVHGTIRILGYQRQTIRGNWKMYSENSRDQYHGSLLHKFQGTFLSRTTTGGGLIMDPHRRHALIFSVPGKTFAKFSDSADLVHDIERFSDERMALFVDEFKDGRASSVCSLFPNAVFQQLRSSLATRQIRPRGPEQFELLWTLFGFEEDDEEMRRLRLIQANLGGPAGYVASEDGEAIEIVHRATRTQQKSVSLLEMGGTGPIPESATTRMNELAVRGFWANYSELMGIEPENVVR